MAGNDVRHSGDVHAERTIFTFSGFLTLALALAAIAGAFWLLVGMTLRGRPDIAVIVAAIVVERFAPSERNDSENKSFTLIRFRSLPGARRGRGGRPRGRLRAGASCRPSRGRG